MSAPDARWQRLQRERDALAARLAADYAPNLPDTITARIFRLAWEQGHAAGVHEVEMAYDDLANLACIAYNAGRSA